MGRMRGCIFLLHQSPSDKLYWRNLLHCTDIFYKRCSARNISRYLYWRVETSAINYKISNKVARIYRPVAQINSNHPQYRLHANILGKRISRTLRLFRSYYTAKTINRMPIKCGQYFSRMCERSTSTIVYVRSCRMLCRQHPSNGCGADDGSDSSTTYPISSNRQKSSCLMSRDTFLYKRNAQTRNLSRIWRAKASHL